MKTDRISFGQTFLQPSLKYLSKYNHDKLYYSYGLGELYPVDIFLGATRKGDLTVKIKPTSLWAHLIINNEINITPQNSPTYLFLASIERKFINEQSRCPMETSVIKHLDYMTQEEIGYEIHDKIGEYFKNFSKYFLN